MIHLLTIDQQSLGRKEAISFRLFIKRLIIMVEYSSICINYTSSEAEKESSHYESSGEKKAQLWNNTETKNVIKPLKQYFF